MLLLSTLRDFYLEGVERRECFSLSIVAIKILTNTSDDLFHYPWHCMHCTAVHISWYHGDIYNYAINRNCASALGDHFHNNVNVAALHYS